MRVVITKVLVLALIWSCDRNSSALHIRIIVPEGFTGELSMSFSGGQEGVPSSRSESTVTLEVPPGGKVLFQGQNVFAEWHTKSAVTTSGAPLIVVGRNGVADDEVALRHVGTYSEGGDRVTEVFVVGTKQDVLNAAQRQMRPIGK